MLSAGGAALLPLGQFKRQLMSNVGECFFMFYIISV